MSAGKVADWAHYIAATVLMVLALNAVGSWPLFVLVLAAYFTAVSIEAWLYAEVRAQRAAEVPQ